MRKASQLILLSLLLSENVYAQEFTTCPNQGEPASIGRIRSLNFDMSSHETDEFSSQLAKNYRSFSLYEHDYMRDCRDADIFAQKGIAAFQGVAVPPENPANWNIPPHARVDVFNGYEDLTRLLAQGANVDYPTVAAEAQAKFDCWVEQSEENLQIDHIEKCREKFCTAIGILLDKYKNKKEPVVEEETIVIKEEEPDYAYTIPTWDGQPRVTNEPPASSGVPTVVNNINIGSTETSKPQGDPELERQIEELKKQLEDLKKQKPKDDANTVSIEIEDTEKPEGSPPIETIGSFEMYFDWDSDKIKPEWDNTLKDVAQILKENPKVRVIVEGHTDTSGPKGYNYNLSKRRSDAVISFLRENGAHINQMDLIAKGENDLKVETDDGIRNPKNRRVKIKQY